MKKSILIFAVVSIAMNAKSQYNTPWIQGVLNSSQNGYIGIGTSPTATPSTSVLPDFNFQVHGVANYTLTPQGGVTPPGGGSPTPVNYGISSRIGITNSTTGLEENDGGLLMMSEKNLYFENREDGFLEIAVPKVRMKFSNSTERIFVGGTPSSSNDFAKFSIITSDNGLSIKSQNSSKYALRLRVPNNNSNLIEAFGPDNVVANFQVTGAGYVYARRYITTLEAFPDYVFQSDYKLKTFAELRDFINTNKHLPNMPTAADVEKNGADLGEINRVLVEKVEELTLYILELEERVVEVESMDEEESTLQERITRLEELILELSK